MKTFSYGIILGITLSILIVLTNVVFPNNSPDSSPLMLVTASVIGLCVILAAYHAGRGDMGVSLKVGTFTSFLGFSISMLTFIVIDNSFLSIVSRQADKAWGFQHSAYPSMQAYINAGLLRGVVIGIPASITFGLMCGWIAATIIPKIRRMLKAKLRQ